jgi:hypothetical protein
MEVKLGFLLFPHYSWAEALDFPQYKLDWVLDFLERSWVEE